MDGEMVGDFLAGGGEMGALTRGFDWSKTSLGSPEKWPQSLRVTVRLVLTSRHPMFIWWGRNSSSSITMHTARQWGPKGIRAHWERRAAIVGMRFGTSLAPRLSTSWQVKGR